jgi:hypothetical protein
MAACGPSAAGDDGGDGEGDGDGSSGATDGSASAGSADDAASASASASAGDDTGTTNPGTTSLPDTSAEGDDDGVDDGTKLDIGGGASCDFEEIVCSYADGSKTPPVDCGIVSLADDAQTWQDAHACAAEAFAAQGAVKLIWQQQGIDSDVWAALVGFVGEVYDVVRFDYDSEGVGMAWSRPCGSVVVLDDCAVGVGEMCFTCTAEGDPTPLCVQR